MAYRPLGETGPAATVEAPEEGLVVVNGPFLKDKGPATLELHMTLEEGRYVIAEMHMWAGRLAGPVRDRPWSAPDVDDLMGTPSPGGIDLEAVRRFNYRPALRQALAGVVRPITGEGELLSTQRKPSGTDPNWDVALGYVIARAVGDNPTAAVAEDFGISRSAAAQRVRRARQLGYLPKTTRGRT